MFRKIVFLVVITLFNNNCDAQNLTFDQLISLRVKALSDIDEFLTSKNWTMLNADEPVDGKMGKLEFAYNKSNYDDKAESFLYYYYSSTSNIYNRISIQVHKINTYNNYVSRIKILGYLLKRSYVDDGDLVKIYQSNSKGITVKIRTSTQQDELSVTKTLYSFTIYNTLDFNLLNQ